MIWAFFTKNAARLVLPGRTCSTCTTFLRRCHRRHAGSLK